MTAVYLASPIDLHNSEKVAGLRTDWTETAFEMGFSSVFDPSQAWSISSVAGPHESLQRVNLAALQASDALIAILPSGIPTLGVPLEIHMATSLGKPTLVVTDAAETSWTLSWLGRGGALFYQDDLQGFVRTVAESLLSTPEEAKWDARMQDWAAKNRAKKEMGL